MGRENTELARYFKPLQQHHLPKDACYKWGIRERERYAIRIQALGGRTGGETERNRKECR